MKLGTQETFLQKIHFLKTLWKPNTKSMKSEPEYSYPEAKSMIDLLFTAQWRTIYRFIVYLEPNLFDKN